MFDHLQGFFDTLPTGVKFTIADGKVTAEERVFGTHSIPVHLSPGATFTVGATGTSGTVTETLPAHGAATQTLTYTADATDASLYHLTQQATTFDTTAASARTYGFTLADGKVTGISVTHGDDGKGEGWHHGKDEGKAHDFDVARLPATAFTVSGNTVTETTIHGDTLETLTYTSTDGATYKLATDTLAFLSAGSATTQLDVEPADRMHFTLDGANVTAAQAVRLDGSTVDLSSHSAATIAYAQPAAGYVVETVTRGEHSFYEVFHDGNGDGVYTAVAHGAGTTVDIVGLQAQITPAIDALL